MKTSIYPLYITKMGRWGDPETHHHIVACTQCPVLAACQAMIVAIHRGRKYEGIVLKMNGPLTAPIEIWRTDPPIPSFGRF